MAAAEAPRSAPDAIDDRVVKALGHPTRIRILNVLRDRELASPVELSAELGVALGTVGYHVRRLETLGFIELAKRTQRRGAVEHHYRACATLDPPPRPRRGGEAPSAVAGAALDACQAAHRALANGGFDAVVAAVGLRVVVLDPRGQAQLQRSAPRWDAAIARIERASARRLAKAGADAAHACTAVTMLFDVARED